MGHQRVGAGGGEPGDCCGGGGATSIAPLKFLQKLPPENCLKYHSVAGSVAGSGVLWMLVIPVPASRRLSQLPQCSLPAGLDRRPAS